MRPLFLGLTALLAVTACSTAHLPIGFWSRNRVRADGSRQGPWRTYYDDADTRLATQGHYRRDKPRGRWRYYRPDGSLDHTDNYHRHGRISIRYYRPNGLLAKRGQARVVVEPDTVRFYWYGLWQLYDSTGRASRWELYDKGWRAAQGAEIRR